jgi:hypothetical protein
VRFLRFILIGLALYTVSWIGAFALINAFDSGFWRQCAYYLMLAWTFEGLERVAFTWLVSLGFFGIGLCGVFLFGRGRRKA